MDFWNYFFTVPAGLLPRENGNLGHAIVYYLNNYACGQSVFYYKYTAGILLYFSIGFTYLFFEFASKLSKDIPSPPSVLSFRVPALLLVPVAAIPVLFLWVHNSTLDVITSLWSILLSLFVLNGFTLIFILLNKKLHASGMLFALYATPLFFSQVYWVFAAIGVVDSVFNLRAIAARIRKEYSGMAEYRYPVSIIVVNTAVIAIIFVLVPYLIFARMIPGSMHGVIDNRDMKIIDHVNVTFEVDEEESRILIIGEEESFLVDMYEYPNRMGAVAEYGKGLEEARNICKSRGKHLCTASEWHLACSMGGSTPFYVPGDMKSARENVNEICGNQLVSIDNRAGIKPGCRNQAGVFDMMRNVREIVDMEGNDLTIAIMGRSSRRSYDKHYLCSSISYVYSDQFKHLNKNEIGFRCCEKM